MNINDTNDYSQLKASTITRLIHSYLKLRESGDTHVEKLDELMRDARDRRNTVNRVLWNLSAELIDRGIDPPDAMYYAPKEVLDDE